jgi:hypothetical protein
MFAVGNESATGRASSVRWLRSNDICRRDYPAPIFPLGPLRWLELSDKSDWSN